MLIAQVDWERLFPILEKVVQMSFIIAIIAIGAWAYTRTTRLKNNMVERGFSASEIEDVMKTKGRR